jgi:N-acetylglucosamine kinase-like BadF-type ATPase
MQLFLGVDGGQTSTAALIGDASGAVLARGVGGPSNHVRAAEGRDRLIGAVTMAVASACAELGMAMEQARFDAACMGFTGGIDHKEEILRELIDTRRLSVTDDVTIALAGAHPNGTGIVIIAGTGSVAMARNASGETARAGGWGYMFGDEGAAWGIVRDALRAAFRAHEAWGPPTMLHDLFLAETGDTDIHVFRRRLYTEDYSRPKIAGLSKLVAHAAEQGDAVATHVLISAADSLVTLTEVVRSRVFARDERVDVAHGGGVFANPILREEFRRRIEREGHVRVIEPHHNATMGALLEAIRLGRSA